MANIVNVRVSENLHFTNKKFSEEPIGVLATFSSTLTGNELEQFEQNVQTCWKYSQQLTYLLPAYDYFGIGRNTNK